MVKPAGKSNLLCNKIYEIDISKLKNIVNIIQSIVVTFGIIFGGIWFLVRAEYGYRANVDFDLTVIRINDERMLGHVEGRIGNTGKVKINLENVKFIAEQILPLYGDQRRQIQERKKMLQEGQEYVDWINLREIPPRNTVFKRDDYVKAGEEANVYFEFEFSANVEVIQIYLYVQEGKKNRGWQKRKICTIKDYLINM